MTDRWTPYPGRFPCPVCHQSYPIDGEDKEQIVLNHVLRHRGYEDKDVHWLRSMVVPEDPNRQKEENA